jgi:hypothetical protein
MFYFRLLVTPATRQGDDIAPGEAIAHVMSDLLDIEEAAMHAVKKLRMEAWRIENVLNARSLAREERFARDEDLRRILADAENSGFSYQIETMPAEHRVTGFPQHSLARTEMDDYARDGSMNRTA